MLVLSIRLACATASITSTMSFGHGPRSSVVMAMSAGSLAAQFVSQLQKSDIDGTGAVGDLLVPDPPDRWLRRMNAPRNLAIA